MSYILDALKKSQQQRQTSPEPEFVTGGDGNLHPSETETRQSGLLSPNQAVYQPAASQIPIGLWWVVVIILCAVMAALAALWQPSGDLDEAGKPMQDRQPETESQRLSNAQPEASTASDKTVAQPQNALVPVPMVRGIQAGSVPSESDRLESLPSHRPEEPSAGPFDQNPSGNNQSYTASRTADSHVSDLKVSDAKTTDANVTDFQPGSELSNREMATDAEGLSDSPATAAKHQSTETKFKAGFGTGSVQQRTLPPLSSLRKVPDLIISSHVYSQDSPESRSVSMNGRTWYEGELIVPGVFLESITAKGIELSVDGYSLPVSRKSGWQGIGGR